jgi:hypothetical protein
VGTDPVVLAPRQSEISKTVVCPRFRPTVRNSPEENNDERLSVGASGPAGSGLSVTWLALPLSAGEDGGANECIDPAAFQIFLGVAEVLAAIGLTLPGITRIRPRLVPLAAAGLMIVMVGATVFHLKRGEYSSAATTAVLLVALTFVAYMRWKVKPISPRAAPQ